MARHRETLDANLAPGADPAVRDISLAPGNYIFNRATAHGVTETFACEILLDPENAHGLRELFLSTDVPFDIFFQRPITLAQTTVLRMRLITMDLEATRWSGAVVEYDLL